MYQNNKIVCDNQGGTNDMHTENCKHDWNKNIEINGKILFAYMLEELILLKGLYYPKKFYRVNTIPINSPMMFSHKK